MPATTSPVRLAPCPGWEPADYVNVIERMLIKLARQAGHSEHAEAQYWCLPGRQLPITYPPHRPLEAD